MLAGKKHDLGNESHGKAVGLYMLYSNFLKTRFLKEVASTRRTATLGATAGL